MCWQIPHSALASTNESLASSSPRCQVSTLPLRKDAAKLRGRRALPPRTTHKRSAPRATAKAGWEEWTPHLRLSGSGKHRSAPRPGSPSARCPCAPILSGNRPREPEAALSFRRRPRGARCPGRPPPKCRRSPETPPPQVRPSTEASGTWRTASRYVRGQLLQRSWRALPRGRLSPNSEVTAPGSVSSVGCGGRDAPAPIEGGKGRWWARSPYSPLQLGPAAPSRPRAPTALARPRRRRRRWRLLPTRARGRLGRRRLPPLPAPPLARSPSPARLRRLRPPRAVTRGDSALATCAAPAPAHARPSDADPGVGRRGAGAGAAAAGARARPLPAAPAPRNPEGGPFTRQLGGTKRAPGRGRLPRAQRGARGGKEENGGGGQERREAASGLLASCRVNWEEMGQGKNSSNFRIVFLKAGERLVNIERLQIQVYTVQVNDPPVQVPLLKHSP
ncbi:basic proline-rich protein-like [Cervus elaphus]|uniref:basic proline-rich protein-like n=1 Tax=Cervus elaphus TaxID=9860 RepID=UPI001CC2CBF5|nr:basic proline-rich protein-like [Cervus elaphus]